MKRFIVYARHYAQARAICEDFQLNPMHTRIITSEADLHLMMGLDNFVMLCMEPLPQRLLDFVHSRRNVQQWVLR